MRAFSSVLLIVVVAVLVGSESALAQVISGYDRTVFIHGFNDDTSRWKKGPRGYSTPSGPDILDAQYVHLKQRVFTQLPGYESVPVQADSLRRYLSNSYPGRNVLATLSMGGLNARYGYHHGAGPHMVGLVTVAAPHNGTLLADNSHNVVPYFNKVRNRVINGIPVLSAPVAAIINLFLGTALVPTTDELAVRFGVGSPAMLDLKVGSARIAYLQHLREPNLPRANVFSTLSPRDAVYRLAASSGHKDHVAEDWIKHRKRAKNFFKTCSDIGKFLVVGLVAETPCEKADKALGGVDEQWLVYVNGATYRNFALGSIRVPKTDPFDGVISNWRQEYPGLLSANRFTAADVNHMQVQYKDISVDRIGRAMIRIGMIER